MALMRKFYGFAMAQPCVTGAMVEPWLFEIIAMAQPCLEEAMALMLKFYGFAMAQPCVPKAMGEPWLSQGYLK